MDDYQKKAIIASGNSSTDIRRYGASRRSQVETFAQRSLMRQFGISQAHAKTIAELAGLGGSGAYE